jgi:hypothetical protein
MRHASSMLSCALAALTASAPALATPPSGAPALPPPPPGAASSGTDDVLLLRDGSMLRGRIAERQPDGTTVILLITGEVRTVPGDQLAAPPTMALPPPPPPPAVEDEGPALSLRARPGRVPLMLESTGAPLSVGRPVSTATVVDVLGSSTLSLGEPLCSAPCTLYVRPGTVTVWSGGNGLRSDVAHLQVPEGGLRARLRAGSSNAFSIGQSLTWSGGSSAVSGVLLLALVQSGFWPAEYGNILAGISLGIGAVMLGIGIPLIVANRVGVEEQGPLESGRPRRRRRTAEWSFGGSPLPGGGLISTGVVF